MESKLIKHAYKTYKIAPLSSWILGLTTGILMSAVIALDLLVPCLSVLTFPFLILPMVFSATFQHIIFKTNGQLTVGSSVRSFGLYYRREFNSSFGFLFSLLKSIILFFTVEMLVSFVLSYILQTTNPAFSESVENLYVTLESGDLTLENLNEILYAHGDVLFNYMCSVLFPAIFLAILFLIYNLSRNSLMIYYRLNLKGVNGRFVAMVYRDTVRRNRMRMLGDYFKLNWPLYLLLVAGFVGGILGGYFWKKDLITMLSLGLLGGTFLSSFFLPFYFGNQEALFDFYANEINISSNNVTKYMLMSLQSNIDLSVEEKERLEKALNDMQDPLEDHKPDDNKKDPDGPQ